MAASAAATVSPQRTARRHGGRGATPTLVRQRLLDDHTGVAIQHRNRLLARMQIASDQSHLGLLSTPARRSWRYGGVSLMPRSGNVFMMLRGARRRSARRADRATHGRLYVVVTTPGIWSSAPPKPFTPEQLTELCDINVPSTQRVNRAALRTQGLRCNGRVLDYPFNNCHRTGYGS